MLNRYRKTYAEINLEHLYQNYKSIQEMNPNITVIPVVKANAYGHGVIEVVSYLLKNGIDHFAVSLLEEALEIREKFKDVSILVMGVTNAYDFEIAANNHITLTISNEDQIHDLDTLTQKLRVHLKVDTGMNRLGFKSNEDILKAVNYLSSKPHIILEGIFTHFATADDNLKYYRKQRERFDDIIQLIDHDFEMIHCSNSSSSIKFEKDIPYTTHSRLGISLYGLTLESDVHFLKNTFKLVTHISEIKHLSKGEKVGYGATYEALNDEVIGILPIGYADGFIRKNSGGDVEVNGKRYPIIGRICMDQMFIKIDNSITKDDDVILFGGLISIDEVAERLQTINYEVICQISSRVPRVYIGKE